MTTPRKNQEWTIPEWQKGLGPGTAPLVLPPKSLVGTHNFGLTVEQKRKQKCVRNKGLKNC